MNYEGNIVLNFNHFLNQELLDVTTPNELRAAADEFACQMEAVELECWEKSSVVHWLGESFTYKVPWTSSFRYKKNFISKAAFHEELDLIERNGFNRHKASIFLTSNDSGEGIPYIWNI